ncbi:unnamed protein product [Caenorhabditis angaria]|uniref:BTB domain-containing protein n=1 Tax=Caenorhabditis angaria TaxID=860376 RepID=A0A9P1IIV6_9PELO|nr:unnamed protein product [Caenorhabditis angaria]
MDETYYDVNNNNCSFISQTATSPPPNTAIDNTFGESPCKRARFSNDSNDLHWLNSNVRLILSNDEEMIISRRILSNYSNYFKCLFSSQFNDSKLDFYRIRIVNSTDLHYLLTIPRAFENGIKPELSLQRAIQLIEPAAYLQIDIALDYLTDVICQQLNYNNIIRIFHLSLLYHTHLAFRVWQAILNQFQMLVNSNEYLNLNEDELIFLLTDKNLNIRSQDEKRIVENWRRHHNSLNSANLAKFSLMNFARKVMPDSTKYEVIRNRQPRNAIIAFGGWSSRGVAQKIEIFNTRCDRWQTCTFNYEIPTIKRAYHGNEIVDDKLIIFGGFGGNSHYQTTLLFDLKKKDWKWGKNMHDCRCYVSSVQFKDSQGSTSIFACGGMNGTNRLNTVERYDVEKDMWTECSSMAFHRSDGANTLIGGKVMSVGGFDGRNFHSNAELYDPNTNQWQMLGRGMRTRRTGCSAVTIMDQVCLVVGGFNGSKRLDSAEMYDLREGIWHPMPLMHCGRSNYGISVIDNHIIHVAGGFDGQATTKENERLDLRVRHWQALPDLNEPKSALRLLHLNDHSFLDDLFNIPDDFDLVNEW